ncbi:MAG: hybrid sensor histidine kinase/response regulator, partial [Candidatus Cloacimonetes bacterium]|nr:hybrid sensor histidine kinase/response regulator [Candidatus Cloacimonadota bacterium]
MFNKRIIIIDDNADIQEDYRAILNPQAKSDAIYDIESFLVEEDNAPESLKSEDKEKLLAITDEKYELEFASQGEEGYRKIKLAIEEKNPFAVAFIDMRMPPGWDGLETSRKIREIDRNVEIVIVTAYADVPRKKLAALITPKDKLLYLKKPFSSEEILQLAANLTSKYYLNKKVHLYNQSLRELINNLRSIKGNVYADYMDILKNILTHILKYVGTKNGMLAIINKSNIEQVISIGEICLENTETILGEVGKIKDNQMKMEYISDCNYLVFPLTKEDFEGKEIYVFAIEANEEIRTNTSIMKILVETLQDIFANILFQKKYVDNQKLAAIGLSASKIIHDLKNPLGSISGFSQLISYSVKTIDDEQLKKEINEMCTLIATSAENMLDNIQSILEYSQGKFSLVFTTIEVNELLDHYIKEFLFTLDKNKIEYIKEMEPDLLISVDIKQFKRVIDNVISNAIQAFNNYGVEHRTLSLSCWDSGATVSIEIANNGSVVTDELKDCIFEPFKTYGGHKGAGLGL